MVHVNCSSHTQPCSSSFGCHLWKTVNSVMSITITAKKNPKNLQTRRHEKSGLCEEGGIL